MNLSKVTFYLCFWLLILPFSSQASERHALVIGNSNYEILDLEYARNNAIDMATQLQSMGYKIYSDAPLFDLDRLSMEQSIADFAQSLPRGASAVFYYAGHGMVANNESYLLPVNRKIEFQLEMRDRAVGLWSIVQQLKIKNWDGVNVLLLDACRNPLPRNFGSHENCLQKIKNIPQNVFIGYATEVREFGIQSNGGDYGIYTNELLTSMAEKPNLSIGALHAEVAGKVYKKTNGAQLPFSQDMVDGKWCIGDCQSKAIVTAGATQSVTSANEFDLSLVSPKEILRTVGCVGAFIALTVLAAENGSTLPNSDRCLFD